MRKIAVEQDGQWRERDDALVFAEESAEPRVRLRVPSPRPESGVFPCLVGDLTSPIQLLYVLHTPRGEGLPGRYQSPELDQGQVSNFLRRFGGFFTSDARADLWVRSAESGDLVVWDRHDDVFVYGNLEAAKRRLLDAGFRDAAPKALGAHQHFYRAECDEDAIAILGAFAWSRTPLRTEDEQVVPQPSQPEFRALDAGPSSQRQDG